MSRIVFVAVLFISNLIYSQNRFHVYFIPGQGSDYRLFSKLKLRNADTTLIYFPEIEKNEKMSHYACKLLTQIDTTLPFVLCGVSLGGMIAVEMAKIVKPEKLILISSAKIQQEIPFRYKINRFIPIYKLFGGNALINMTHWIRKLVEPDYKKEKKLFIDMLNAKSTTFMRRSIQLIVQWKNSTIPANYYHVHGDNDHTLPFRKITGAIRIIGGSHMMTLTRADEISDVLNTILDIK